MDFNQIYNEDCITGMQKLSDNCIDLCVTSPPYNLGVKYDVYNDWMEWDDYYAWCELWLQEVYRVLKPDGRFCLNHYLSCGTSKTRSAPLLNLNCICNKIGFKHHGISVWDERTLTKYQAWGCYDEETEVLTDAGFKKFKNIDINCDLFATLNPTTQSFEYQRATNDIKYHYNGEMYSLKSRSFDLLITPNHNMVYYDKSGNICFCEVEKYFNIHNSITIPQGHFGYIGGQTNDWFYLPPLESHRVGFCGRLKEQVNCIQMNDWLKFLGIFITDGNCYHSPKNRQYKISIYQSKSTYLDQIRSLLNQLPFSFKEKPQKSEYYTCNKQLSSYLITLKNKNERIIPEWICKLPLEQIRLFLDWVFIGDGSIPSKNGNKQIAVPSKQMADTLTHLLIMVGQTVSVTIHKHQGGRDYNGVWFKGDKDLYLITYKKSKTYYLDKRRENITKQHYTGIVYCVSVPNKILCVRRNGKITWCGNSWKSASSPYVNSPYECILITYKDHWKKDRKGETEITPKEFMESCSGIWKMQPVSKSKSLTIANFPVELPMRCIKLLSYKGDVVLDPFSGSGTTAYAAKVLGRQYVGFEISKNYWEISQRRVEQNGLDEWVEKDV
jgi:DNA modification methylase